MQDQEPVSIAIALEGGPSGTVEGRLKVWSKHEALMKGIKGWAIAWGLGFVTVFIPIVHFVSVPVLFFAGPLIAFGMYRMHADKVDVEVPEARCPKCAAQLSLPTSQENWPVYDDCPNCGGRFTASLA